MLTETEALHLILEAASPLPAEHVPLRNALNRYAASPVRATVALPGFDNSAMDGYAILAAETRGSVPLKVVDEQPAGMDLGLILTAGTAIRIFTGAPMPAGADAVIMQEDVERTDDGQSIVCKEPVERGENIRLTGCDLCVGQRIIAPGEKLTPARLALLASQGLDKANTVCLPKVAVITTGDELVRGGLPLKQGQLYNSNGIMLESLVRAVGTSAIDVMHLPDDLALTTAALREAIAENDVILLAGGVSVGDHDHVKQALANLGIKPGLWRVKVKPGKPLLFCQAEREKQTPCFIFGLPGNPVSAYVTYQLFVRSALLKICGAGEKEQQPMRCNATLASPQKNGGDRPHYVRGNYYQGVFTPLGVQQSHALYGLSQGNALLRLAPLSVLETGATVQVMVAEV